MKAMELRNVFHYTNDKALAVHQDRVKTVKKVVDNSEPTSLSSRVHSPRRHLERKKERRDVIARENLILARKIFNIMEGSSMITDCINDTRHFENHPGTMNFKFRLSEAQRIHNRNMILAARLDSIQPYYKMSDIYVAEAIKRKPKKKTTKFARELEFAMNEVRGDTAPNSTRSESPTTDYLKGFNFANSSTISAQHSSLSARQSTDIQYSRQKPHTVLLEYTKVQDGRVLSVAVLKEPFRDRYAIFGIDVDVGQRYELRLTSDEVSSILDGDILVTSVDNVEVWMALLNKVSLNKVEDFAKLPFTGEEVDLFNSTHEDMQQPQHQLKQALQQTQTQQLSTQSQNQSQQQGLVASRPTTERPSSRATTSRGGARSRGGAAAATSTTSESGGKSVASGAGDKPTTTTTTAVSAITTESAAAAAAGSPTTKEMASPDKESEAVNSPEAKRPVVPKLNLNSQSVGANRLAVAKHKPEVPSSSAAPKMANTSPRINKAPASTSSNKTKNTSPARGAVATTTVTSPTPAAPTASTVTPAAAAAAAVPTPSSTTPAPSKAVKPAVTATPVSKSSETATTPAAAAVTVTSPVAAANTSATTPASGKPQFVRKSIRDASNKSGGGVPANASQKTTASPASSASVKTKPGVTSKEVAKSAAAPATDRKTALELSVGEALIESAVMQAIYNVCNATERATKSRQNSRV